MRHQKSGRKLGRNSPHRTAMFRNMAASLLRHETVRTTLPKAKELRRVVEPLITLAKEDGVHRRRLAFSRLRDDVAVGRLFTELGPRFKARPGGYLRILKMGYRAGRFRRDGDRAAARPARERARGAGRRGRGHGGSEEVREEEDQGRGCPKKKSKKAAADEE